MHNQSDFYLKCINRAVDALVTALANESNPSLEELADAACLSKYHFHRVFRLMTGETCQQMTTRLKLAKAAGELQNKETSVTEVALKSGFSSSQALAKALKREVNVSASELRAEPERLADTLKVLSSPTDDNALVSVELTNLNPMTVLSVHSKGVSDALNTLYAALFEKAGGPENVTAILGISQGNTAYLNGPDSEFDCALLLGEFPDDIDSPFGMMVVDGTSYARLRHTGSYVQLDGAIDQLYCSVMASKNLSFSGAPCMFHYLDDPEEVDEASLRADIYLPVHERLKL